ncbi:MAG TPA: hypothetical protein VGQ33_19690, partial [Vicinamibacteria bacterium]|nr:hypothetical protein [Vicinamibacteria bacterium]
MNATNAERSVLDPDSVAVRGVLGALAAYHIVVVVLVALARMRYPFELEWNEGASLEQMLRLLEHKP